MHRLIGAETVDEWLSEDTGRKSSIFDSFAGTVDPARMSDAIDVSEPELARGFIADERCADSGWLKATT
ncbi:MULTISPECIES: hypothetical protein [unclassified Corynebacterium]|uniref:hypothetical protein n=1 Tax=unclassified Corynebacterium TaxID=2624378 RepID=UPI0035238FFA